MDETGEDRQRLAEYVTAARRVHFGTVEQAIRAAGVNRATWLRVEAGENVRDDKLTAVERALGWEPADAWRVMAGGEPGGEVAAPSSGGSDLRARVESTPMPDATRSGLLALLDGVAAFVDSLQRNKRAG